MPLVAGDCPATKVPCCALQVFQPRYSAASTAQLLQHHQASYLLSACQTACLSGRVVSLHNLLVYGACIWEARKARNTLCMPCSGLLLNAASM